jgi:microcin C transport system permease protein
MAQTTSEMASGVENYSKRVAELHSKLDEDMAKAIGSLNGAVAELVDGLDDFLEEIGKQYVLTARAKGLSEGRVLWKQVLRNALIPLVTGFPAAFVGAFFTGSLLIETLFSLDGLGLLSYESVMRRDYPVVLGTLYLFTLIGLFTKLISDLCYLWVDPRVKFE